MIKRAFLLKDPLDLYLKRLKLFNGARGRGLSLFFLSVFIVIKFKRIGHVIILRPLSHLDICTVHI
jgi:hypothetical protein